MTFASQESTVQCHGAWKIPQLKIASKCCEHKDKQESNNMTKINHPLYPRWKNIMYHCYNENSQRWLKYGGRGIAVHEPWHDFWRFANWCDKNLGPEPWDGAHLDRRDNDKNYQPGNLQWSTARENQRNRTATKVYRYKGKTQGLADWADEMNMKSCTLWSRINTSGLTIKQALETPLKRR
jgi:hypothetical protein